MILHLAEWLKNEMDQRIDLECRILSLEATLREIGFSEVMDRQAASRAIHEKREALAASSRLMRDIADVARREWGFPETENPGS